MRKPWTTPTNPRKSNASFLSNHSPFAYSPLHYTNQYAHEIQNNEDDDPFDIVLECSNPPILSEIESASKMSGFSFFKYQYNEYLKLKDYAGAIYYAQLMVYSSSNEISSVFELCSCYYLNEEYHRSLFYLKKVMKSVYNKEREEKKKDPDSSMTVTVVPDKLGQLNVFHLAIQCCIKLKDWEQAMLYIETIPTVLNNADVKEKALVKIVSSLSYLSGLVYQSVENHQKAVEAFKNAVLIDQSNTQVMKR
jgi:tetratricopeptide (TPR) repeat protein